MSYYSVPLLTFLKQMEAHAKEMQVFMEMTPPTRCISEVFKGMDFATLDLSKPGLTDIGHQDYKPRVCQAENLILINGRNSFLLDDYSKVRRVVFHDTDKNFTFYNMHRWR